MSSLSLKHHRIAIISIIISTYFMINIQRTYDFIDEFLSEIGSIGCVFDAVLANMIILSTTYLLSMILCFIIQLLTGYSIYQTVYPVLFSASAIFNIGRLWIDFFHILSVASKYGPLIQFVIMDNAGLRCVVSYSIIAGLLIHHYFAPMYYEQSSEQVPENQQQQGVNHHNERLNE